MKNRFKFFSKNAFLFGLISLFNDVAAGIVVSILPLYMTSLGISVTMIGFIEGFADGFSNVSKGILGFLEDRIKNKKRIAFLGYFITAFSRILLVFANSFYLIFGVRLLDRFGKGVREPARDALLAYSSEKKTMGKSFGLHRAMDTLGGIIGPGLAVLLLLQLGRNFNAFFIIAFVVGTLSLSTFLFVDNKLVQEEKKGEKVRFTKEFKILLLFSFIFSLGNLPIVLLLLKARDFNAIYLSPVLFLFFNIFYAIFLFLSGVMVDKIGPRKVIFYGLAIGCLSFIALIVSKEIMLMFLGFGLYGIFQGLTDTGIKAFVSKIVLKEYFSSSYGFLSGISGAGLILSGIIGGVLWETYSSRSALIFALALIFISMTYFTVNYIIKSSENE